MSPRCRIALAALALLCASGGVRSAAAASVDAERREIAHKRSAIEAVFAKARDDCASNFVVTACIDAARSQRRQSRLVLNEREQALAAFERSERALARERALAQKQAALATRSSSRPAIALSPARPQSALSGAPVRSAADASAGAISTGAAVVSAAKPVAPPASSAESVRRAAYERREREARAHRLEVDQRNANRAANKQRAATLPAPASAATR